MSTAVQFPVAIFSSVFPVSATFTFSIIFALFSATLAESTRVLCWRFGLVVSPPRHSWRWGIFCAATAALSSFVVLESSPWTHSVIFAGYCSLLAAMSTVDLEEKILPKGIWLAAIPPVLALSYLSPQVLGASAPMSGLSASIVGALVSAGTVFGMVELGKLLFGKVTVDFDPPEKYEIAQVNGEWCVTSSGETMQLSEVMLRPRDSILVRESSGSRVRVWESGWENPEGTPRSPLLPHSGLASSLTIPREAMGMGDVKFMLLAGAMLGWEGGLFSIFAGAVLGTCAGLVARIAKGHTEIPFIPFLASGMVLFMIWDEKIRTALSAAVWGT